MRTILLLLGLCLLLTSAEPLREVQIGEGVSFDGALYGGKHSGAITVDNTGLVTVRIGAAFPLLRDEEGYFVRLRTVRIIK